ncbi:hypothetical protein [Methylobacterium frigidaeris]|uniref:Uncharacterized protein n=1 Tax=Methylobacterium frigidaeris TaxID=2038277 RepID=A0AA37M6Z9_9HYPH|nr:hypothetical protein [Methylobacterium frigidaeris]GJD65155.1 hypothetical protein MPEAHAMD_5342 [Methylobacterium frigidaeris]
MTGPVSPGASPRPGLSPAAARQVEAIILQLDRGFAPGAVRASFGVGAKVIALAQAERARRIAAAAAACAPAPVPDAPPAPRLTPEAYERATLVDRLRAYAADLPSGPQRSTLLHLSDLAEHHPTFYPSYRIGSDGTCRGITSPPVTHFGLGLSPAAACLEG